MSANNIIFNKNFSNTNGVSVNTINIDAINVSNTRHNTNFGYRTLEIAETNVGWNSGACLKGGTFNTGIGYNTLSASTTGHHNTACEMSSLGSSTTGGFNTAIGHRALQSMDTGVNIIGIGWGAGTGDARGNDNIWIGSYNSPDITGALYGNSIALGNGVQITGSNQIYS
jgi:hypothetical protein